MATPAFRAAGTVVNSANNVANPTALAAAAPAGRVSGDLLLCITGCRSITATVATPSGWTLVTGFPQASATASGGKIYIFSRVADGTASDDCSLSWSGVATTTTGDSSSARIIAWQNAKQTQDGTVPAAADASSTTSITMPAITTAVPGSLIVGAAIKINDTAHTFTTATRTERADSHTTTGTGHGFTVADQVLATPGSSGTATVTPSTTVASRTLAVTVAFEQSDLLLDYKDSGDTAPTNSGTVVVDSTTKYAGADSLRYDTTSAYSEWTILNGVGLLYYVRFYIRPGGWPSVTQAIFAAVNTGGSFAARVSMLSDGTLSVINSAGSLVGNRPLPLDPNEWHLIELELTQNATAANGVYRLLVDMEEIQANANTDLTNVAINRFRFGRPINAATFTTLHVDRVAVRKVTSITDNTRPVGTPADLRPSGNERRPVTPFGVQGVNNVVLKQPGDRIGVRFVLDQARSINRMLFGCRLNGVDTDGSAAAAPAALLSPEGYGSGNGGTLSFELFAVNAATGLPTGSVIASDSSNAVDRWIATRDAFGLTGAHMFLYATFATGSLAAGEYVVIIKNTHASPTVNWCSVNCPTTNATPMPAHGVNTRSQWASGAIAGLDPRECVMWSIDAGAHWYWGQPVGGQTIAQGITNGEHRDGSISGYYVSTGDDEIRLPWFAFWDGTTSADNREAMQPYYGLSAAVSAGRGIFRKAGRAVTLDKAGAFARAGESAGTVTVTNLHTGVSGNVVLSGNGWQEGTLSSTVPVAAGETFQIGFSGAVGKMGADVYQEQLYGMGYGDWPFSLTPTDNDMPNVYALPWPYFAAPDVEPGLASKTAMII